MIDKKINILPLTSSIKIEESTTSSIEKNDDFDS